MSDADILRSPDEIVRYYKRIAPFDFFGVWGTELLIRVPLRMAIPFMKDAHDWTEETWKRAQRKCDKESIVNEMEDFIQDAIERINRHTKLAVMSLDYYRAWSWLLKDMDLFSYLIDDRNFPNFGAPMINAVIQQYHFEDLLPEDALRKSDFLNMAQGRRCNELCRRGCSIGRPTEIQKKLILPTGQPARTVITPKVV